MSEKSWQKWISFIGKKGELNDNNIRNICGRPPYSMTDQCTDKRMNITKKLYEPLSKLIAFEFLNNPIKRAQILNGNIPIIIDINNFTRQRDVFITRIK